MCLYSIDYLSGNQTYKYFTIIADATREGYHNATDKADFLHHGAHIRVEAVCHRYRGGRLEGRLQVSDIHPRRDLHRAILDLHLGVHAS